MSGRQQSKTGQKATVVPCVLGELQPQPRRFDFYVQTLQPNGILRRMGSLPLTMWCQAAVKGYGGAVEWIRHTSGRQRFIAGVMVTAVLCVPGASQPRPLL